MWAAIFWYVVKLVIVAGISYGVAALTKKKPEDIVYDPDTFDTPEIKEGKKFPIIFGTCWVDDLLMGWFGDILDETIRVRLSDTDGQYVYLHKYYYGALHILAQGTCDGIKQIKVGDQVVWPDSTDKTVLNADSASSAAIDLPELYGGIHEHNANVWGGGGLVGTIDFEYGEPDQAINSYLEEQLGSDISANRGLTCAVMNQTYIGMSTQIRPWKYLLKRTDLLTTGEIQWYSAKSKINDYEINPIHILHECYTDTEWALVTPAPLLNDITWQAAADTLYTEGFGMCIKWQGDQSLEDFVKDILRYIDAVIYEDHSTGYIEIKLIRDDYDIEALEEFDENDIDYIDDYTRGTIHKVPDITQLTYWNMIDNLPVTIDSPDMALINSQNESHIPNEVKFTGVINDELGGQLGAREQQQLSAFGATMTIAGKRTMAHLTPGDVKKISYPPLGIVSMVIRIVTPHYGTLEDGKVSFDCIEDIFGMKDSVFAAPPTTGWDDTVEQSEIEGSADGQVVLYNAITDKVLYNAITDNIVIYLEEI